MKGYFYSKPLDIEEVRGAISMYRRYGDKPTTIIPIGSVNLDARTYKDFSKDILGDWGFLQPYRKTVFNQDGTADCVLIQAEGQPTLAVCMEGFGYARYVALVLEDEPKKRPPAGVRKG